MKRLFLFFGVWTVASLLIVPLHNAVSAVGTESMWGCAWWTPLVTLPLAVVCDAVLSVIHVAWADADWPWRAPR